MIFDLAAIRSILIAAVDDARRTIPSAANMGTTPDTPLFGDNGLDSLGLVRFIVMVEERIEDATGQRISLASERAMSRRNSPFRSLATLADFIRECLDDPGAENAHPAGGSSAV